ANRATRKWPESPALLRRSGPLRIWRIRSVRGTQPAANWAERWEPVTQYPQETVVWIRCSVMLPAVQQWLRASSLWASVLALPLRPLPFEELGQAADDPLALVRRHRRVRPAQPGVQA